MVQQLREIRQDGSVGDGGPIAGQSSAPGAGAVRSRASCLPPDVPGTIRVRIGHGGRPGAGVRREPGRPGGRQRGESALRGVPS